MSCQDKHRYASADQAKRTLRKIQKQRRHRVGGKTERRVYACAHCRGYHLTANPLD
jgi:hypothetical protein